jgi:hypothetical protein
LERWVTARLPDELARPPLDEHVATLRQIIGQDLEPDPDGSGRMRIRQGVAEDRRVSIEDKEMRHGRKTKSKRFNGYKRHLAIDLDTVLPRWQCCRLIVLKRRLHSAWSRTSRRKA